VCVLTNIPNSLQEYKINAYEKNIPTLLGLKFVTTNSEAKNKNALQDLTELSGIIFKVIKVSVKSFLNA
jgi:hypothetical protein